MRIAARALLVCICVAAISCTKTLATQGDVLSVAQKRDPGLAQAASGLQGMSLQQDVAPEHWSLMMVNDATSPRPHELYSVEWGQELSSVAKNGRLADLGRLWPRAAASRVLPGFVASVTPSPAQGFIPAAVSTWGLFYNRALYQEMGSPPVGDMKAFVTLLDAAKARGVVPIALGTSFGWPGAAWFSYVDLRLNGGRTAWERVMGKRPFDDKSGIAAADVLAQWRNAGYFSSDARGATMQESLNAVETGRALFVLMGAFASQHFGDLSKVGFMEVPSWKGKGEPRGEIAELSGFAIAASSAHPEPALALVDAYVMAASKPPSAEGYGLPMRFRPEEGPELTAVESRILAKTRWVFPSEDRIMPPQFVQDSIAVWTSFFSPQSHTGGAELVSALRALREKSVK